MAERNDGATPMHRLVQGDQRERQLATRLRAIAALLGRSGQFTAHWSAVSRGARIHIESRSNEVLIGRATLNAWVQRSWISAAEINPGEVQYKLTGTGREVLRRAA